MQAAAAVVEEERQADVVLVERQVEELERETQENKHKGWQAWQVNYLRTVGASVKSVRTHVGAGMQLLLPGQLEMTEQLIDAYDAHCKEARSCSQSRLGEELKDNCRRLTAAISDAGTEQMRKAEGRRRRKLVG